ncbi:MAG: glycosyltransferase family 2 protein [Candidatus Pacebacteria bacterium]|jgi:glycosyltransferase involved in cell wall biosynthesis|nr:glycosyltransferase family 2 protein [Candidatus Paceibacterota bacterium]MBT4652728.1 glycosyltransferase family 2 protein [Candidatus Paceibacterota bacterium]MBT6755885.1 glycosyltransferase family 2 protein [Candidatus Paceibacterota bacterium]MBT6921098.1 glycosyltransferase family 2 protein [Candidatus Paceibacterota bacterium]
MKNPLAKVTVVFPALNEEKNIGGALDSLLIQEKKPAQIIFVNHNSQDKTLEIAESFIKKFLIYGVDFKIITEKKKGISNARNAGCSKANQPIIASMDTDCRPSDQWVKVIEEVFAKEKKIDALAGKVIFFDGSFFGRKVSEWGYYAFFYSWMKLFTGFHPFTTANAAFRTSVYKKIGGFDATIVSIHGLDDVDLAGRMSNGDNIRYEKRMTVYASSRRYKDFFKMVPDMIQRFKSLLKITRKYKQRKKIF